MLRRTYDRTMAMADHPQAMWWLALVAFVEASVFPIPPDVLMIPMILARPQRAFAIAGVALGASVLGGLLGYAIGALAYDTIGQPILATMGKAEAMDGVKAIVTHADFADDLTGENWNILENVMASDTAL